jgi:hypothetical protein
MVDWLMRHEADAEAPMPAKAFLPRAFVMAARAFDGRIARDEAAALRAMNAHFDEAAGNLLQ